MSCDKIDSLNNATPLSSIHKKKIFMKNAKNDTLVKTNIRNFLKEWLGKNHNFDKEKNEFRVFCLL